MTVLDGAILSPILPPVPPEQAPAACRPELLTKEDLFLLYAEHFFSYDINPAGFGHVYGVYDPTAGETSAMCLGIEDRQALMRNLMLIYKRLASSLRYCPLPTYIEEERHTLNNGSAMHLNRGYVTGVGERACAAISLSVPLMEDSDGMWAAQVTMPSSTSIHDLVVYESGVRNARIPIASRSLSGTTATLRFYRETLVSAVYWAECGASRTSCDCSAELKDPTAFAEFVDVYLISPVSAAGLHMTINCSCRPRTTTMCGVIEDPVLGWVRGMSSVACVCETTRAAYGQAYYTSGRWTRDTLPDDVREALFGAAISIMPETSLCQEATRPLHFDVYRLAAPTDAPGGMRAWGQVLLRTIVSNYANGSGI